MFLGLFPVYRGGELAAVVSADIWLTSVSEYVESKASEGSFICVVNSDVTIVAQRPKLLGFMPAMRENIARGLGVKPERVNVKATTTEGMGFEGEGQGISAQAVALLAFDAL